MHVWACHDVLLLSDVWSSLLGPNQQLSMRHRVSVLSAPAFKVVVSVSFPQGTTPEVMTNRHMLWKKILLICRHDFSPTIVGTHSLLFVFRSTGGYEPRNSKQNKQQLTEVRRGQSPTYSAGGRDRRPAAAPTTRPAEPSFKKSKISTTSPPTVFPRRFPCV